ncbi:hypothetical protein BSF_33040 [Bacillus subtilis]|nr:hypothetical protein BSF_33040 [Bacillus subtilis]
MKLKERSETVKKGSKSITLDTEIQHVLYWFHDEMTRSFLEEFVN